MPRAPPPFLADNSGYLAIANSYSAAARNHLQGNATDFDPLGALTIGLVVVVGGVVLCVAVCAEIAAGVATGGAVLATGEGVLAAAGAVCTMACGALTQVGAVAVDAAAGTPGASGYGGAGLSAVERGAGGGASMTLREFSSVEAATLDGYSSFRAAKSAFGPQDEGFVLDHVVEQSQAARSGFPKELVNSPQNLAPVPTKVNQLKADFYSSKQQFSNSLTVRDWLSGQSFEEQHRFGLNVLRLLTGGSR